MEQYPRPSSAATTQGAAQGTAAPPRAPTSVLTATSVVVFLYDDARVTTGIST